MLVKIINAQIGIWCTFHMGQLDLVPKFSQKHNRGTCSKLPGGLLARDSRVWRKTTILRMEG